MEPSSHKPVEQYGIPKTIFIISALIFISIIIYTTFQINYFQKQLVIRESQLLELENSKGVLEGQLQEANLKLVVLNSANAFLEKNTERLSAIREFLQGQLNMINEQLTQQQEIISTQQEIITSLGQTNDKLDLIWKALPARY